MGTRFFEELAALVAYQTTDLAVHREGDAMYCYSRGAALCEFSFQQAMQDKNRESGRWQRDVCLLMTGEQEGHPLLRPRYEKPYPFPCKTFEIVDRGKGDCRRLIVIRGFRVPFKQNGDEGVEEQLRFDYVELSEGTDRWAKGLLAGDKDCKFEHQHTGAIGM